MEEKKKKKKMYTHVFTNDDMTTAQIVTKALLNHHDVTFAACKKRHPLENNIDVSFSVMSGKDELQVLKECLQRLQETFQSLEKALNNIEIS